MDNNITFFAETNFRNQRKRFGIKIDDRRRHMYVIGQTGTGKTTLLMNMLISDIIAGHGVGFIDPHGDMAENLLNFIPEERIKDVIYFNPADMNHPIAFNAIEKVNPEAKHLVASGLMGVFKKIWPDVWSARMEYILNNTVLALLEIPNTTLLGINRMFSDKDFRKTVVDQLEDPVIKTFWTQEYAKYQQRYEQEATAAIQNKIGQFSSAAVIRNIIGQPHSSFDFRQAMDEKKIIIMNLSKGRIGEDNSKLLGGMLITKIQLAAMSRVDILEDNRNDFYLYVDEFQNFVTDSFATILSEARKYHLNLIITNQYIGQLINDQNTKVKDAVFGNVGTFVAFRTGGEDVEFLEEKQFGPDIVAADLLNLPNYNIYLRLMIDGVPSRPFSAMTLPPAPKPENSYADEIIRYSRETYGTPRAEVEKMIAVATGANIAPESTSAEPSMFDAVCVSCKKEIQVPFKPDSNRPVYCKECFAKSKQPTFPKSTKIANKFSEDKKQRKVVNLDELKKILENTVPKQ
ncbi:MAG: type IV secretion system DNA-binding domain-containing protein [Candidatus Azambacteria bacterium]|nr:type IV secretion system DNA-binding domain-containing protein [Candidatus Azambacteria bacterium]